MKSRFLFVIAMGILMVNSGVSAGPIQGAGALPCGEWISKRETSEHNLALAWVMGFMSAYNHYVDSRETKNGVFGETSHNSLALWMDNYCKNNPLKSVYRGSLELIDEMNHDD